jgi:hypothetical protein
MLARFHFPLPASLISSRAGSVMIQGGIKNGGESCSNSPNVVNRVSTGNITAPDTLLACVIEVYPILRLLQMRANPQREMCSIGSCYNHISVSQKKHFRDPEISMSREFLCFRGACPTLSHTSMLVQYVRIRNGVLMLCCLKTLTIKVIDVMSKALPSH